MRPVQIPPELLDRIHGEARMAYPEECCGFLLSARPEVSWAPRRVVAIEPAPNRSSSERRRRFVILPAELRAAEGRADASGHLLVGFYHSHPDHPAVPSTFDQEHAWPWYTYVIVSVDGSAGPGAVGAFELAADRSAFHPVSLSGTASMRTARTVGAALPN